jgi:anti-sigma B factor antagonist
MHADFVLSQTVGSGVNFNFNRCVSPTTDTLSFPARAGHCLDMEHELLSIELADAKSPDTRVICLQGPLTISTLFDLQRELRNGVWTNTILEMLGVPYMDSAGMGAIINFYVSCKRSGRRLIVCGLNYRVIELFKLTNVDKLITITDDLDQAEAILKAES